MGLGTSKKKILTNEEIEKYSSTNKTLEKYYSYYRNYDGYISLKDFEYCFNKRIDKKIIKILFKIFASEKDKLLLNDLKYFYSVFQQYNFQVKLNFISLLIFSNKNSKNYPKYVDRVNLIFNNFTPLRDRLLSTEFIVKISDISKKMPTKIYKDLFQKHFETMHHTFIQEFQFLKGNYMSSVTSYRKGAVNVSVCDCYLIPNKNKFGENNNMYDFLYEKMEVEFKRIEKLNDGIFQLNILEKILFETGVNTKLVNLILIYIKRKIQRNFIDFKTFKLFLLSFTMQEEQKIKYLFEILSYPYESIDRKKFQNIIGSIMDNKLNDNYRTQINSYLCNFEVVDDNVFSNFVKENTMMYDVLNNLERVNYIPYLYFKLRPDDKNLEKKCIELIMKGEKNLRKYIDSLLSSEENEDEFYCLDFQFWENWCDYVEWNGSKVNTPETQIKEKNQSNQQDYSYTLKPRIRTDNLTEVYNTRLKSDLVYFKDFIVLPKKVYDLFSKWYVSNGVEIKLNKIKYNFNLSVDPVLINQKPQIYNIVNNKVYEIEINPIYSKFFTFEEILTNIPTPKKDLGNDLINQLFTNTNFNLSRLVIYSRKTTLKDVKCNIEKYYKMINIKTRLWVFNKEKNLELVDLDKSLEEEKINGFCLFILDITKNNQWISDMIYDGQENTLKKSEKEIQPSEDVKKISNKDKIIGFQNIGNTCYMNATLQVLLNIKELSDIFMSKNSKYLVNYANKFGYKGKIFKEFLKLFEDKISNEMIEDGAPLRPAKFKEIIGEINSQFSNFEQQDAQEFINFLLDILHEEMNVKDTKEYIPNPEKFDYTEEELANEYWSNNLRRNASFIHSLFVGQLKSNLICEKCENKKITYETFTNLNLPITQKRTINLQIILHRLPFVMKAYYEKLQDDFYSDYENLKFENGPSNNIQNVLKMVKKYSYECFNEEISKVHDEDLFNEPTSTTSTQGEITCKTFNSIPQDSQSKSIFYQSVYTSRLSTSIPLKIILEVECKSKVEKIIEALKKIKELELEQDSDKHNISYSTFAISSPYDGFFYDMDLKIDECFQNDQTICVFEFVNTKGLNKLMENKLSDKIIYKQSNGYTEENQMISPYDHNIILGLSKEVLSNFNKPSVIEKILLDSKELKREYLVQITHRYSSETSDFYLFRNTNFMRLDFHITYLLVNNDITQNINSRFLYQYVWEKYEYIFHNPGKIKKLLWWLDFSKEDEKILQEIKYCSPFVIKILNRENNTCTKCPWFKFCSGCILDPFDNENIIIYPTHVIVVEWCYKIVKNEINDSNLKLILNHENVKTKEEDKTIKTLSDCINLFLEKEYLEGGDQQIYCGTCRNLQNFYKKYDFDRVPPILILTLKRFKFAKLFKNKIDSLIDFPLYDLETKGVKYNLYGVINHLGSLQSGHYTSIIKVNDKWIRCDDSRCQETQESSIISPLAYILVYKVKEEIHSDYYRMMTYILNSLDLKIECELKNKEYIDFTNHIFLTNEPVMTIYGRGYVVKEIFRDGVKLVHVKFRFGEAVLNPKSIIKELQHYVSYPNFHKEIFKDEENGFVLINKTKEVANTSDIEKKHKENKMMDRKLNKKQNTEKKNEEESCMIF